jgi:hypothetical protein
MQKLNMETSFKSRKMERLQSANASASRSKSESKGKQQLTVGGEKEDARSKVKINVINLLESGNGVIYFRERDRADLRMYN